MAVGKTARGDMHMRIWDGMAMGGKKERKKDRRVDPLVIELLKYVKKIKMMNNLERIRLYVICYIGRWGWG